MYITKDMVLDEVIDMDTNLIPIFFSYGMACLGCMMAQHETIEQAAAVHQIDIDDLLADLNKQYEEDLMAYAAKIEEAEEEGETEDKEEAAAE